MERHLFVLQRISAMALAPFVIIHLGLILYAVRGGLTAGEILGRTQGSIGWGSFYGLFVVAAAVHAPIGLRNILREWTPANSTIATFLAAVFGALLIVLGFRAVFAVVA